MSKNKKRAEYDAGNIIDVITEKVNKKGKIKGKNKKETKALKSMCMHHIKKNGKIKSKTENVEGKKYIRCKMCEKLIPGQLLSREEVNDIMRRFDPLVQQMKFMAASMGADKQTIDFAANLGLVTSQVPGVYDKMTKVVAKKAKLKSKNKSPQQRSAAFGGWRNNG